MWRVPIAGQKEAAERRAEMRRAQDALRRERDQYRHLYGLAAWKNLRLWKLSETPMCEAKEKDGSECREGAYTVHHIKDHHGDLELFFDRTNLASLCKRHHDQETMRRVNAAKNGDPDDPLTSRGERLSELRARAHAEWEPETLNCDSDKS